MTETPSAPTSKRDQLTVYVGSELNGIELFAGFGCRYEPHDPNEIVGAIRSEFRGGTEGTLQIECDGLRNAHIKPYVVVRVTGWPLDTFESQVKELLMGIADEYRSRLYLGAGKTRIMAFVDTLPPGKVLLRSEVAELFSGVLRDELGDLILANVTNQRLEPVYAIRGLDHWTTDLVSLRKVWETPEGPRDGADPRDIIVGFRRTWP